MQKKIKQRGGDRPGSGRKKKFEGPTTRIYITVPISVKKEIKEKIETILKKYQ